MFFWKYLAIKLAVARGESRVGLGIYDMVGVWVKILLPLVEAAFEVILASLFSPAVGKSWQRIRRA